MGTPTERVNCHPFRYGRWLFMHNGAIGGYESLRHALDRRIPERLYSARQGNTDTEVMFMLALANGLESDPAAAMAKTVAEIEEVARAEGVEGLLNMTVAVSDGERVFAFRYSTDHVSPSLYFICEEGLAARVRGDVDNAVLVLSEPLDEATDVWTELPEAHMLVATAGTVTLTPFTPSAAAA